MCHLCTYHLSFANMNKVWHTHKQDAADSNHRGTKGSRRQRKLVGRWLTIALGVAVGLTGCFVTFFTEWIIHAKLHFIAHIIEEHEGESGGFWSSRERSLHRFITCVYVYVYMYACVETNKVKICTRILRETCTTAVQYKILRGLNHHTLGFESLNEC